MTKHISAFLFCFKRELNPYSPLTYSLTSAYELKPHSSAPSPSAHELKPLTSTLTLRPTHPF